MDPKTAGTSPWRVFVFAQSPQVAVAYKFLLVGEHFDFFVIGREFFLRKAVIHLGEALGGACLRVRRGLFCFVMPRSSYRDFISSLSDNTPLVYARLMCERVCAEIGLFIGEIYRLY